MKLNQRETDTRFLSNFSARYSSGEGERWEKRSIFLNRASFRMTFPTQYETLIPVNYKGFTIWAKENFQKIKYTHIQINK